jgi:hypothetical protein
MLEPHLEVQVTEAQTASTSRVIRHKTISHPNLFMSVIYPT